MKSDSPRISLRFLPIAFLPDHSSATVHLPSDLYVALAPEHRTGMGIGFEEGKGLGGGKDEVPVHLSQVDDRG